MTGDGFAIEPEEGLVCAPFDGTVSMVFPSKHAIGLTSKAGIQVLIHIGLDTVNLNGEGFTLLVNENNEVKAGEQLIIYDMEGMKSKGYNLITLVVFPEFTQTDITISASKVLAVKEHIKINL